MANTIKKDVRVPFMASERFVERIDKYAATHPQSTRAEAMRELMEIGLDLPVLVIDLLDALEAEGLLYYEDIAKPAEELEKYFEITKELEFTQVEKGWENDIPYKSVKTAIVQAQIDIEAAKLSKPKAVRKKLILKKKRS